MILVTGAGGFIGSHFVNFLKEKNYDKIKASGRKKSKYIEMKADEWIPADLFDINNCIEITKGVEQVYHLAASMGGIQFVKGAGETEIMRQNVTMDLNMLEASRINGVKRFLFTSSSCAYPKSVTNDYIVPPMVEELCYPADPDNAYGWGKILTEQACAFYRKSYGMETRVARLFSTYGNEIDYDLNVSKSLVSLCIKVAKAKNNSYIEIWGEGKEYRSFCYYTDVMEGIYRLMQSDYPYPMNIGSDQPEPIQILAQRIINVSGKKLEIVHLPAKTIGVKGRRCDITRARDILHWEPKVSIDEGLKLTYSWIENQLIRKDGVIDG